MTSVGPLYSCRAGDLDISAVAAFAIVPFGDAPHIFGTRVGLYGVDTSVGPLYVFAFGAIAFYGLMLGGWASGSKYSFLGRDARRRPADLLRGLAGPRADRRGDHRRQPVADRIVHAQGGMWYFIPQFVGFIVFTCASFAEVNRAPSTSSKPTPSSSPATSPSTAGRAWSPTSSPST